MLIPIIQDYYREGRLPVPRHRVLIPFFPNCNLSVRRSVFDSVGDYDEELKAAEDSDLCRRAAINGFSLFFEPSARVFHACRPNLSSLFRQWYSYGYWSAMVYRKHMENKIEVYSSIGPVPRVNSFSRIISIRRFPFPVLCFLTYFAWVCAAGLTALLMLAAGSAYGAAAAGIFLAFYLGYLYLKHPVIRGLGFRNKTAFLLISAFINLSCVAGSLLGGFRNRMLYIFSGI